MVAWQMAIAPDRCGQGDARLFGMCFVLGHGRYLCDQDGYEDVRIYGSGAGRGPIGRRGG